MGFYAKHIFPRILDWSAGAPEFGECRRRALEPARGETLEIGFGTGLNLPYYPEALTKLTAIDSENMLEDRVEKRVAACVLRCLPGSLVSVTRDKDNSGPGIQALNCCCCH